MQKISKAINVWTCMKLSSPIIQKIYLTVHRVTQNPIERINMNKKNISSRMMDSLDKNTSKSNTEFQKCATKLLQDLSDKLDLYTDIIDSVDLIDSDTLEIHLADNKGTFVLNKHYVQSQIWYSSPVSGADYFFFHLPSYKPWVSEKTKLTLHEQLSLDLKKLFGTDVLETS